MSQVSIFIATTSPDIIAEVIVSAVKARRGEMDYIGYRELRGNQSEDEEVEEVLEEISEASRCALVLVGRPDDTSKYTGKFLAHRADLVVLQVDIVGANVRLELRNPQLSQLLNALRQLVERFGARATERISRVELYIDRPSVPLIMRDATSFTSRPLLEAATDWIHAVLVNAIKQVPEGVDRCIASHIPGKSRPPAFDDLLDRCFSRHRSATFAP